MHILDAARKLRPGTAWNLSDGVLSQAIDGTPRVDIPSASELEAVMADEAYAEKRRVEYPKIEDQLDAIWKGGAALDEMREKVMAVKAKYPKPS